MDIENPSDFGLAAVLRLVAKGAAVEAVERAERGQRAGVFKVLAVAASQAAHEIETAVHDEEQE